MASASDSLALAIQYQQAGQFQLAEPLLHQALQANPNHVEAWFRLGKTVQALGRHEEAISHFQRALLLEPTFADAYNDLGIAQANTGQFAAAAQTFQEALHRIPGHANAAHNLGVLYGIQGQPNKALVYFRQAVSLAPVNADYLRNLGNALRDTGHVDEALACFQRSLSLNPHSPWTHNELGNALLKQGLADQAERHYRESLRLAPTYANAHLGLGAALADQRKLDDAIACYEQAIHYKPDLAESHNHLGNALLNQGLFAAAVASYRRALATNPELPTAQSNLLFCGNYDPDAEPDAVFAEHRQWGNLQERGLEIEPHANDRSADRRLRIGYVSPDFRKHAVTRYFEPVLAHHDHAAFEVFCYAEVAIPDAVTARLKSLAQGWRSTSGMGDAQVADQIRQDRIDILVDLAGHSANHRLRVFARKPAPVQATWLGYMNTTGLSRMDYRLTDDVLDPPGQPRLDTEELIRIPGGMCSFAPPQDAPPVAPLPALRTGHITFGSLHNLFKLNDKVFDLWSQVLHAVPGSRLLMFRHTLTGMAAESIRKQFLDRGIAGDKLDLRQGTDAPGYLKIYDEIDVGLDSFPYTGGVTTCESLWMGVPVLSLAGTRPAGRNSAALLTRAGLADWVAQTPEQFLAIAARLPDELGRLSALRVGLRDQVAKTLCDAPAFTQKLEEAYLAMWRRWTTDLSPKPLES